jgi:hypothetical protein
MLLGRRDRAQHVLGHWQLSEIFSLESTCSFQFLKERQCVAVPSMSRMSVVRILVRLISFRFRNIGLSSYATN